jgi:hypothetical protein
MFLMLKETAYCMQLVDNVVWVNGLLHAACGQCCRGEDDITPDMLYSTKNGRIEFIGVLMGKSCDVNVFNLKGGGYGFFLKKNSDSQCC